METAKNEQIDESSYPVPDLPDPFWPEGAVPKHLSKQWMREENKEEEKDDKSTSRKGRGKKEPEEKEKHLVDPQAEIIDAAWKAVGVDTHWRCMECGASTVPSKKNPQLCVNCYEKSVQQTKLAERTNDNWMEQSEQLGLAIYERQPEETDEEWRIWEKYRSFYPLQLPAWTVLAKDCGCSVAKVTRAAQRWNYKARMVAWARFTDGDNQEKRIKAIRAMNEKQLSMAQRLQDKLSDAIDQIDPALLRPGEISNLMKLATDLERRITTEHEEKVESTAMTTQTVAKPQTKAEDMAEVLEILQNTGVMPGGKKVVGVETKTTMLIKEDTE